MANNNPLRKTERLDVRLTPEQKEKLKELAAKVEMSISDYIIARLHLPL